MAQDRRARLDAAPRRAAAVRATTRRECRFLLDLSVPEERGAAPEQFGNAIVFVVREVGPISLPTSICRRGPGTLGPARGGRDASGSYCQYQVPETLRALVTLTCLQPILERRVM